MLPICSQKDARRQERSDTANLSRSEMPLYTHQDGHSPQKGEGSTTNLATMRWRNQNLCALLVRNGTVL